MPSLSPTISQRHSITRPSLATFSLESHANFDDVAKVYGLNLSDELRGLSLDSAFKQLLHKPPVIGDSVELGHVRLTIREMDGPTILIVGLKLV